jgi:predicted HTH domain antitoxin
MERITVELDLPRDLLGVLRVTEDELGPELKLLIALELFQEEKISSKAAEVVGLSKSAFID